jgi:hypothetical protein
MSKTPKKPASKTPPSPKDTPKPVEGTVLGPGVVKRPKRDPSAPAPASEEIPYTPSDQVFRRR